MPRRWTNSDQQVPMQTQLARLAHELHTTWNLHHPRDRATTTPAYLEKGHE